MDYNFFFLTPDEGGYVGCGLALAEARFSDARQLPWGGAELLPTWPRDQTKKAAQWALATGLGLGGVHAGAQVPEKKTRCH